MIDTQGFHLRYQPPKANSTRTILLLHGTGGDENSLFPIAGVLDANAAVISVRGKVLENGAPRFFRRISEGVFDLDDLHFRTQELAEFIWSSSQVYRFDPKDLIAVGYSNGANIASSLLISVPECLSGAVLFRAMVPYVPDQEPNLAGKRVFVSEGKSDPIVPLENADHLAAMLMSFGAEVHLQWNDLDHRIGRQEVNIARDWLSSPPRH